MRENKKSYICVIDRPMLIKADLLEINRTQIWNYLNDLVKKGLLKRIYKFEFKKPARFMITDLGFDVDIGFLAGEIFKKASWRG